MASQSEGLLQCYNVFWYVLQRTAGPSGTMTSCNVLNSSAVCILRTCFLNATLRQHGYCGKCNDSFGTQAFFACCSALRILPSTSLTETHSTDGCISPMKLGACSPASFVFGDGMLGNRSLAFFASSLSSLSPPLRGVLTLFDNWICDRS